MSLLMGGGGVKVLVSTRTKVAPTCLLTFSRNKPIHLDGRRQEIEVRREKASGTKEGLAWTSP